MAHAYHVRALWDDEALVWVSESDIPGLVIEADTLAEFQALMRELAPEMLRENGAAPAGDAPFRFSAEGPMERLVA